MHKFKDSKDVEWRIELNAGPLCDVIADEIGIDLLKLEPETEEDVAKLNRLVSGRREALKVAWLCLEDEGEQLKAHDVTTFAEFRSRLTDVSELLIAVWGEIMVFIRHDPTAELRLTKAKEATDRASELVRNQLGDPKLMENLTETAKTAMKKDVSRILAKYREATANTFTELLGNATPISGEKHPEH